MKHLGVARIDLSPRRSHVSFHRLDQTPGLLEGARDSKRQGRRCNRGVGAMEDILRGRVIAGLVGLWSPQGEIARRVLRSVVDGFRSLRSGVKKQRAA